MSLSSNELIRNLLKRCNKVADDISFASLVAAFDHYLTFVLLLNGSIIR